VEILRVEADDINLQDLAELEHYENLKEAHLYWFYGISVKEALPILNKCTNLRRLTLKSESRPPFPTIKEICEFIIELEHLTFLHIIYGDTRSCGHFKSLIDQVKASVLRRRPNFKFHVSCCKKFGESRVPREFFFY
jgi:hypothetical protein